MSTSTEEVARDGVARIKPEYVVKDHKRKLSLAFMSDKDKAECLSNADSADEPAKKKLKGQNKKRPREPRVPRNERFCPCLINDRECPFGDNCDYVHDTNVFLAKKPEDIKPECPLFNTYGKCPFGITCRFGSKHIDENGRNVIDKELSEKWKDRVPCRNRLSKELQCALRKRQYDFSTSNSNIQRLQNRKQLTNSSDKANCVQSRDRAKSDGNGAERNVCDRLTDSLPQNGSEVPIKIVEQDHCAAGNESVTPGSCSPIKTVGAVTDEDIVKLRFPEVKQVDFFKKLYLAPLTTVGNLPFRRICKRFGADVTCGEMAVSVNLLQGMQSEWALVKRHESEDVFGVQLSGAHADVMTRCTQLLCENSALDFIDINVGCPIDLVYKKGGGCALMNKTRKLEEIVSGMRSVATVPITAKIRTGVFESKNTAHLLVPQLREWGTSLVSIHGRSREQRYTKSADWDYVQQCAKLAEPMPLFGNGDVLSYEDYYSFLENYSVSGVMIGRGALFKPWIFTEIKERRHYDISSRERFDILQDYVNYGLEHWGADSEGVEKTRRFLLEWLSFLYRYIPVGLLEHAPQRINERPPCYMGRDDLETLMASPNCADWIKISEMLLGPVPTNFSFLPKHKANSYK